MQRVQLFHRVVPRLNGTRALSRTFVSSGRRQVGTPQPNPSNNNYNNPEQQMNKSHATGESVVPEPIQRAAPEGLEKALPESVHPTKGSDVDPQKEENTSFKSHATGPSVVPEFIQKVAPAKLEKALPESIHPTKGSDVDPEPVQGKNAK